MAEPSQPRSRDITVGPAPTYKGTTLYTNSWALVIGINRYEDERIPALQFAEDDAQDIAALLPSLGFPSNNIYMRLGSRKEVTRDLILEALEEELNPQMEHDDRLLLYFAGHGVITKVHEEQRGYLLLPNSKVFGGWPTRERPYLTRPPAPALEMGALLNAVRGLPAKHRLVLVDSCFSGFMARDLEVRQVKTNDSRLAQWTREPVTQVFTAGRSGQQSRELAIYGHGVFSWYVLKGLQGNADPRGDGLIAFSDLVSFVRDRVAREPDVDQDPQPGRFGEGEFVFVYSDLAARAEEERRRETEPEKIVILKEPIGQSAEVEQKGLAEPAPRPPEPVKPPPVPVPPKPRRTSPWAYVTAGSLIVLILLVGGLWYRSQQQAEEARRQLEAEAGKKAAAARRLAELLAQAKQQLAAGRLTTPARDNALATYREILREVPGHEEALEGIGKIKEQYVQWAEAAKRRGEWAKAQEHYEDALTIAPQDETLVAALQQVKDIREEEERQQRIAEAKRKEEEEAMRRAGMVPVPAGEFLMGSEDGDNDEKPVHRVYLDAFYIDKYEVTVAEYGRCVQAGRCSTEGLTRPSSREPVICNWGKGGRENYPINCVDWNQAKAYCEWAGKRLPTEAEWEKGARGADGRTYPWGNQWDSSKANADNSFDTTVLVGELPHFVGNTGSVGSYPSGVSPYGVHDMAGNVWEWVEDWYDGGYYQRSPRQNPKGPDGGQSKVMRGGSWSNVPRDARASHRGWGEPGYRHYYAGFRCAR